MPTKAEFKVQKRATVKGKAAVWVTIARSSRRGDAERTARHAEIDNPKSEVRIEGPTN